MKIITILLIGFILFNILMIVKTAYGQTIMTQEQREALINYCYQHADRPNPLQDLIDKGLLPESFGGETCLSVKQMYHKVQTILNKNLEIQQQKEQKRQEDLDKAFIEKWKQREQQFSNYTAELNQSQQDFKKAFESYGGNLSK
jgi:hypothetical protein